MTPSETYNQFYDAIARRRDEIVDLVVATQLEHERGIQARIGAIVSQGSAVDVSHEREAMLAHEAEVAKFRKLIGRMFPGAPLGTAPYTLAAQKPPEHTSVLQRVQARRRAALEAELETVVADLNTPEGRRDPKLGARLEYLRAQIASK